MFDTPIICVWYVVCRILGIRGSPSPELSPFVELCQMVDHYSLKKNSVVCLCYYVTDQAQMTPPSSSSHITDHSSVPSRAVCKLRENKQRTRAEWITNGQIHSQQLLIFILVWKSNLYRHCAFRLSIMSDHILWIGILGENNGRGFKQYNRVWESEEIDKMKQGLWSFAYQVHEVWRLCG